MANVKPARKSAVRRGAAEKGERITGARREKLSQQLRKKYEAGKSVRELAESTGRSYGFVHRILRESGATMRGRGGATTAKSATRVRAGRGVAAKPVRVAKIARGAQSAPSSSRGRARKSSLSS